MNSSRRWAPGIFLWLTAFAIAVPAYAAPRTLVEELERIEASAAPLCPSPPDRRPLGQAIAELSDQLRVEMRTSTGGDGPVKALNDFLFKKLAIQPSRDLHDPCNLLPSAVLARKQGYCVGIAAVYLALAESVGVPVHAVATPSHVFLRYEGTVRVNIETFESGAPVPEERYIAEEKIAPESIRKGIFLRALTASEFLAQVHNDLGVIYSYRENYPAAAREYTTALHLLRDFPAARYNWGNDLLKQGDYGRAITYFSKALKLHPNDVWALNNRGMAYRKLGKEEKARRDFERALSIDSSFAQARGNLDRLPPTR